MVKPFSGEPVPFSAYFRGTARDHLWGIVGGMIWSVGMMFNIIAVGLRQLRHLLWTGPRRNDDRRLLGRLYLARIPRSPEGHEQTAYAYVHRLSLFGLGLLIATKLKYLIA